MTGLSGRTETPLLDVSSLRLALHEAATAVSTAFQVAKGVHFKDPVPVVLLGLDVVDGVV